MEINLTQEELDAFVEMGIDNIENYLKSIANSHIKQNIDKEILAKTFEEKKSFLSNLKAKEIENV